MTFKLLSYLREHRLLTSCWRRSGPGFGRYTPGLFVWLCFALCDLPSCSNSVFLSVFLTTSCTRNTSLHSIPRSCNNRHILNNITLITWLANVITLDSLKTLSGQKSPSFAPRELNSHLPTSKNTEQTSTAVSTNLHFDPDTFIKDIIVCKNCPFDREHATKNPKTCGKREGRRKVR